MRRAATAALLTLACLAFSITGAAQQKPSTELRLKPIALGDTTLSGFILPAPPATDHFYVDVLSVAPIGGTTFIDRVNIASVDTNTGAFSVQLSSRLVPGRRVQIGKVGGDVLGQANTPSFQGIPVLRDELHDGGRIVQGHVEHPEGVAEVRVRVMRSLLEANSERSGFVQIKSTSEIDGTGEFSVTLADALKAGQVVKAEALPDAHMAGSISEPITVTDPGSWGRARAYFAAGVVFSKEHGDFSQQDLALTFAIDKSWLQKSDFVLKADRAFRQAHPFEGQGSGKWTFRQLNTVFDTRLTALPVVTAATPAASSTTTTTTGSTSTTGGTTPAGGSSGGGTSGAVAPGRAAATVPDDAAVGGTSTTDQFVSSRKGAVMQIGIYAPVYGPQTSWVHDGAVNTLFVAPVVRLGIQTIVGQDSQATTDIEGNPDDVFNFYSFGFAVGHQKLSGTTNQTPELISYLHLTWGKAEAFKYKDKDKNVINPTRLMVEGRLKIPDTPLQIGFDANLGQGHDDLRFIFGTRFDIGALFEKLKKFE